MRRDLSQARVVKQKFQDTAFSTSNKTEKDRVTNSVGFSPQSSRSCIPFGILTAVCGLTSGWLHSQCILLPSCRHFKTDSDDWRQLFLGLDPCPIIANDQAIKWGSDGSSSPGCRFSWCTLIPSGYWKTNLSFLILGSSDPQLSSHTFIESWHLKKE